MTSRPAPARFGRGCSAEIMEIELQHQGLALLLALGMGIAVGLVYDLLRPLRRRTGKAAGAALDVLFCLLSGFMVFSFAMGAGDGRLGLWELTAALLGFVGYLYTLSRPILRIFTAGLDFLCNFMTACKNLIKKTALSAKIIFQKVRECFIIKK